MACRHSWNCVLGHDLTLSGTGRRQRFNNCPFFLQSKPEPATSTCKGSSACTISPQCPIVDNTGMRYVQVVAVCLCGHAFCAIGATSPWCQRLYYASSKTHIWVPVPRLTLAPTRILLWVHPRAAEVADGLVGYPVQGIDHLCDGDSVAGWDDRGACDDTTIGCENQRT